MRAHHISLKRIGRAPWSMSFGDIATVFGLASEDVRVFMMAVNTTRLGYASGLEYFYGVRFPQWAVEELRKIKLLPEEQREWPLMLRDLSGIARRLKKEGL